jgi:hypothetical protein
MAVIQTTGKATGLTRELLDAWTNLHTPPRPPTMRRRPDLLLSSTRSRPTTGSVTYASTRQLDQP